jgi:hypothetical protein
VDYNEQSSLGKETLHQKCKGAQNKITIRHKTNGIIKKHSANKFYHTQKIRTFENELRLHSKKCRTTRNTTNNISTESRDGSFRNESFQVNDSLQGVVNDQLTEEEGIIHLGTICRTVPLPRVVNDETHNSLHSRESQERI